MSRVNRIQTEIKQLEGGTFQNLCDKYLYIKYELETINSLGSMEGTHKPTKGIPDTYIYNELNDKYTMVMYGTDKDSTRKLKKDIEDAIEKPGILVEMIERIICCHTSSNISVDDDQKLRELAAPAPLTIIGIDTLAQDLDSSFKYQKILKEFLRIEPRTDQILMLDDFIKKHDSSRINAPISNSYIGDNEMIQNLLEKLNINDILLIKGNPGTGKTKLAVELCDNLLEHQVITVKSNGLSEYQDIKDALSEDKINYIFIDDANKLSNFEAIVDLISMGTANTKVKLIMTIRDYLFKTVEDKLSEYSLEVHHQDTMTNENLRKLVELINPQLSEADKKYINNLSNGNPRLAILAASINSSEVKNFGNAKDLLRTYYEKVIDDHGLDTIEQKVIIIIHFVGKLNYKRIEEKKELIEYFDLDKGEFIDTVVRLNDKEICDIYLDEAVNLRDQSLGDYLAIKLFKAPRKNKVISLFELLFPKYKQQLVDLLNQVSHFDTTNEWTEYLTDELKGFYKNTNGDIKSDLLKQYAPLLAEEALIYVKSGMLSCNAEKLSITQKDFDKSSFVSVKDKYIEILCSLANTHKSREASDLLVHYLTIKKSKVVEIYNAIKENFNTELNYKNYFVKRNIILNSLSKYSGIEVIDLLILNVIKEYIKFNGDTYEVSGRNVSIQRYQFYDDDYLINFHAIIFAIIQDIYSNTKNEEVILEIQLFLLDYPFHELKNGYERTVMNDIEVINNEILNVEDLSLRDQYIAYTIKTKLQKFGYSIETLYDYPISKEIELYHVLMKNIFSYKDEEFNLDEANYKKYLELDTFITSHYTGYKKVLEDLSLFQKDELMQSKQLDQSLCLMIDYSESEDRRDLIKNLIISNYNVENDLIRRVVSRSNYEEIREILIECGFYNNEYWKVALFSVCDSIDKNKIDEFKEFVKTINDKNIFLNYHICEFHSFIEKDPSILDLFINKYYDSVIHYKFYIPEFISKEDARRIIGLISNEYSKQIYLENIDKGIDQIGDFFSELIKEKDDEFIHAILQKLNTHEIENKPNYDYISHYLWKIDNINEILSKVFKDMLDSNALSLPPYNIELESFLLSDKDKSFFFIEKELENADEDYIIHLMNISIVVFDYKDMKTLFQIIRTKQISFEAFRQIHIISRSRSWTGSLAPLLDRDIEYIDQLFEIFSDTQFVNHTRYLYEIKESLIKEKEQELLRDFFEDM